MCGGVLTSICLYGAGVDIKDGHIPRQSFCLNVDRTDV